MTSARADEYPVQLFPTKAAWTKWLDRNHAQQPGVWLRIAKKNTDVKSVQFADALDVALCYGWIDGQARSFDEATYLQKFTPRGRRSTWSKRNRDNVERLIASGEMRPAGLAAVEAAKADGRWDRAYDSPANATVPDDLQHALDRNPAARARFETLTRSQRFSALYHIQTAVRPETRARRIAQAIEKLARGEAPRP